MKSWYKTYVKLQNLALKLLFFPRESCLFQIYPGFIPYLDYVLVS